VSVLPAVGTGHELDEARALELIFEEDSKPCEGFGKECGNEVEFLLICPKEDGQGQVCGDCLDAMREYSFPKVRILNLRVGKGIRFSNPCGHIVFFEDCTVRPI
jgi:hypothetical protein